MAEVTHLPSDCYASDIIEVVEREGCVVVDSLVDDAWLTQFNKDIQPSVDAYRTYQFAGEGRMNDFLGDDTVRLQGMLRKAPCYLDLILDERLLGTMDHFLLPNCNNYLLNSSEVIEIHGGETAQPFHIDDKIWPTSTWVPDRLNQFNVMVAGTEFTAENGATLVVPYSHKWENPLRPPEEDEIAQAVMSPGSAVFIPGKTAHAGGTNTSGEKRRAIVASFVLGWLRTQENHFLHNTPEEVGKLPKRARQLLGYELYLGDSILGGPLGFYEHRCPSSMFEKW